MMRVMVTDMHHRSMNFANVRVRTARSRRASVNCVAVDFSELR